MHPQGFVLVVGGSGQIGRQLIHFFSRSGHEVVGTFHRNRAEGLLPLEASNAQQVVDLFARTKPTVVVNALNAAGGTDACEMEPELAERNHFQTGQNLADQARQFKAKFVQISTDYVFDGRAGPYIETDAAAPLSKLGLAKLKLEE